MRSPNGPPFCLVRHGGQTSELAPAEFSTIDSLRQMPGSLVWLALRDPGTDDLRTLEDEIGIHELALEDVQKRGQRPKLDTYPDQLTSNALNTIMKRLTAITVILMAPTLIAGIYGMNFEAMPELSWSAGYPLALGLMAAVMIGAYWFFRGHDWF